MTDDQLTVLAERFCAASLPYLVAADYCATTPGPDRTGANLMTMIQAREVLRQVIGDDLEVVRKDITLDPVRLLTVEPDAVTLRDTFASQVLPAIIRALPSGTSIGTSHPETNLNVAMVAYSLADAMLAARAPQGDAK